MSSRRSARSMTAATTVLIPLPSSARAVRVDVTRHAANNPPFAILFPPGVRNARHDFAFLSAGGGLQPYLEKRHRRLAEHLYRLLLEGVAVDGPERTFAECALPHRRFGVRLPAEKHLVPQGQIGFLVARL